MAKEIPLEEIIGTADSPEDALRRPGKREGTRGLEEQILRMRFGVLKGTDMTLEEVGERFAATRERIRQIEEKALQRLQPRKPKASS